MSLNAMGGTGERGSRNKMSLTQRFGYYFKRHHASLQAQNNDTEAAKNGESNNTQDTATSNGHDGVVDLESVIEESLRAHRFMIPSQRYRYPEPLSDGPYSLTRPVQTEKETTKELNGKTAPGTGQDTNTGSNKDTNPKIDLFRPTTAMMNTKQASFLKKKISELRDFNTRSDRKQTHEVQGDNKENEPVAMQKSLQHKPETKTQPIVNGSNNKGTKKQESQAPNIKRENVAVPSSTWSKVVKTKSPESRPKPEEGFSLYGTKDEEGLHVYEGDEEEYTDDQEDYDIDELEDDLYNGPTEHHIELELQPECEIHGAEDCDCPMYEDDEYNEEETYDFTFEYNKEGRLVPTADSVKEYFRAKVNGLGKDPKYHSDKLTEISQGKKNKKKNNHKKTRTDTTAPYNNRIAEHSQQAPKALTFDPDSTDYCLFCDYEALYGHPPRQLLKWLDQKLAKEDHKKTSNGRWPKVNSSEMKKSIPKEDVPPPKIASPQNGSNQNGTTAA